ncbi:MAG: GPR endopeptidase [Oscillospiraceae bacterium]|nr:GPR endopeptidase [Oscillospiraceae bacterium]
MNRTDLALESVSASKHTDSGLHHGQGGTLKKSRVNGMALTEIDLEQNNPLNKPAGSYATLTCALRDEKNEIEALFKVLKGFIPEDGRILVAGLGNANITPDSLGVRAAARTLATAHLSESREFKELEMREVYVVETGVLAQTGMESGEQLKFITAGIKPDMAVVIDSLACSETERLGRTIQVTDTGIAPGSGVGNSRREVSKKSLGIPVVAVGVPTVIDLSAIAPHIAKSRNPYEAMVVPRDIDVVINHFAKIISKSLNRILIPSLSDEEIEKLRF